jgi:hypothetical protein
MLSIQCELAVKGYGYAGVLQEMLVQFQVDAAPQKQRSACVSEIVPTNRGEISTL